ncbi:MAG: DUF4350 domain-containing protein [Planctomycetaceae bacterium]|nr:DUF4350 domain-containing protein [Planctomycetaceae bacterium]
MITGRNVIVAGVVMLIVALGINAYTLLQPLDNDGQGRDSYGVRPSGYRAIFEVLERLDVPVSRSHAPYDAALNRDSTLVLLGPDVALLGPEKGALEQMEAWVEDGGRLVVGFVDGWPSFNFLETFELEEIEYIELEAGEAVYKWDGDEHSDQQATMRKFIADQRRSRDDERSLREDFSEILTNRLPEYVEYPLSDGSIGFETIQESVGTIAIPERRKIAMDVGETKPAAVLNIRSGNDERTLIAKYSRGKGAVILLSDPVLFNNLSLSNADNSILAVDLLSDEQGHGVVFDEFYHGLAIRGNPLWILAQPGYRILALLMLLAVGLYIWHAMPTFGVIHPPGSESRRTLEVYLDSVSRLLVRTKRQQSQLLIEAENAFLWKLAKHLDLHGERHQFEAIRQRLERRDAGLLREFESIINDFRKYQQSGCSSKELLTLLRRSQRCLS